MAERPSANGMLKNHTLSENQGKPDVRGLSNSLVDVSDWHQLGIKLGIPSSELNRIEKDYQGNDRQKTETFISWLKRTPRASWSDVVSALRQMGENTVAESVRQHYIAMTAASTPQTSEQTSIRSRQDSYASTSSTVSDDVFTSEGASVSPRASSSSQSEGQPFGCGCGECTFFRCGCTNPIPSASSFPYLDISGLTHEKQQELSGRLQFESRRMMFKFQHVVSVARKSLMSRGVTLDELLSCLTILETFYPVKEEPISPTSYTDLMNSETIPKVFIALSNYLSFFNYDVLELIINELGTEEDKQVLQKYKDEFQQYAKRRIYQCPAQVGPVSETGHADVFVKVDSHYESYTVEELRGFQHRLSEIFHISSQGVLRLCRVEKGCFQLMFQVPSFVQPKIFPLSSDQERTLVAEGVIKLTCGNYEFVAKGNPRAEGGAEQQPLECDYDCEFVTSPPKCLECPICLSTLRKPVQTSCGHTFCKTCIEQVQDEQCPVCKGTIFPLSRDKRLQKLVSNLQVRCTHQKSGCGWTGELGKLDGHLAIECEFGSSGLLTSEEQPRAQHHLPEKQKQTKEQENQLQMFPMKVEVRQHMTQRTQQHSLEQPLVSHSKTHRPQLEVNHHFTMKKFQQFKEANAEWFSDPFYTHPQGYKLCVRIDANGDTKKHTHVSLSICVMRGEYDNELRWPFHGEIAVELLDQNEGHSREGTHHKCTIRYDDSSRYYGQRVVLGEKMAAGAGESKFIPHSKLDPDQDSTVQYLKDDCLKFRVSVLHVELPASHGTTKLLAPIPIKTPQEAQ